MFRLFLAQVCAVAILTSSCDQGKPGTAPSSGETSPGKRPSSQQRVFQVKGVVKSLQPDGKTVEVRHEEITNYMPAMTMPLEARDPKELTGLKAGDPITFRMTVTASDVWIDQVRKLTPPAPNQLPSRATFRIVRDVEPLQIGDLLPEYHFTNELGQTVSTGQFKGQALALTFIFTRCPLPNFCPLMSNNFSEAQRKLLATSNGPTNWHLLTISFDPEFDTPVILKAYAQRFGAEPAYWNFLTGDLIEITAISEQFGQTFWRDEGALSHNLRTVVINASGRVQRILEGNTWRSDELVREIVKGSG